MGCGTTESQFSIIQKAPKVENSVPLLPLVTKGETLKGGGATTSSESQRQGHTRGSRQIYARAHARPCIRQEERLTYLSGIPSVLHTVLIGVTQIIGNPVVGVITRKEWEDRGVGQKILLTVGALLSWVDATTEEVVHWPNGAFPHTSGYLCPNIRKSKS